MPIARANTRTNRELFFPSSDVCSSYHLLRWLDDSDSDAVFAGGKHLQSAPAQSSFQVNGGQKCP